MKVFITSATGYVGQEIAKKLIAEGHTVVGLARSQQSADKLVAAGVDPVRGDLSNTELLAKAAGAADAVIHTAFHHDDSSGEGYKAGVLADLAAIHAMTKALAGSKKVFIMSSASGFLGNTGPIPAEEQYPFDPEAPSRLRANNERAALDAAGDDVCSVVIRLPQFVWGNGGSFFIPHQIATAQRLQRAFYPLPGSQMTSGVHVEDAADAYLLALKHATPGSLYNVSSSNDTTMRSIAEAVGANLGVPVEGIAVEDAIEKEIWPAWLTTLWSYNNRIASTKAQTQLKWTNHKNADMLEDIRFGSYIKP